MTSQGGPQSAGLLLGRPGGWDFTARLAGRCFDKYSTTAKLFRLAYKLPSSFFKSLPHPAVLQMRCTMWGWSTRCRRKCICWQHPSWSSCRRAGSGQEVQDFPNNGMVRTEFVPRALPDSIVVSANSNTSARYEMDTYLQNQFEPIFLEPRFNSIGHANIVELVEHVDLDDFANHSLGTHPVWMVWSRLVFNYNPDLVANKSLHTQRISSWCKRKRTTSKMDSIMYVSDLFRKWYIFWRNPTATHIVFYNVSGGGGTTVDIETRGWQYCRNCKPRSYALQNAWHLNTTAAHQHATAFNRGKPEVLNSAGKIPRFAFSLWKKMKSVTILAAAVWTCSKRWDFVSPHLILYEGGTRFHAFTGRVSTNDAWFRIWRICILCWFEVTPQGSSNVRLFFVSISSSFHNVANYIRMSVPAE